MDARGIIPRDYYARTIYSTGWNIKIPVPPEHGSAYVLEEAGNDPIFLAQ